MEHDQITVDLFTGASFPDKLAVRAARQEIGRVIMASVGQASRLSLKE